jgi:hypothetical protein
MHQNDPSGREAVAPSAVASAALSYDSGLDEAVRARGTYTVTNTGPRAEYFDQYAILRAEWEDAVLRNDYDLADLLHSRMEPMLEVKWVETIENLVTNVGKIDLLDKYFAGSSYTAAFSMGLVDGGSTPTYNAADTMASHAGWTENTGYSNATRPSASWGSATASGGGSGTPGTGSKVSTATAFNINASGVIAGVFLGTNSTKGGTTGTLYSAGSFTGGNRTVANLDTLNVTYTGQA